MIVNTSIPYNSSVLKKNIDSLLSYYPFLKKDVIGYSFLGKPIYALIIGSGPKEVFYSAAIHANEWITSSLLMKFIEIFCISYINNSTIYGYNARELFKTTTLYIIPMCNPDGVDLVTGLISEGNIMYNEAQKIANNYPNISFPSGWKANIEGVDLNLQFPAGWKQAQEIKFNLGFTSPAPRDYVGERVLSCTRGLSII